MNKKERIDFARFLIERISKEFLQEGTQYIIQDGFQHLRDLITLYGKQTNLLESVLLLTENNMSEEAFILLRSMINNYMLIVYLVNDDDKRRRHKEFTFQPVKSELKFLYDIHKGSKKGWIEQKFVPDIESKIAEREEILKKNGYFKKKKDQYDTTPITISKMVWNDEFLYNFYVTHYKAASAFEHSDPTSLGIYKEQFLDEYSNDLVFTLNLSKTNAELEETVIKTSIGVYSMAYLTLLKYFSDHYEYLIYPEERKKV